MATTFDVIYLGNLAIMDPTEGDQLVDTAAVNSLLGTYGGPGNALADPANIREFAATAGGFSGGSSGGAYDINNAAANETFTVDGVQQTFDASMTFNATITYTDGTTATITAVVFQATNGDTYLAPEFSFNADQVALEAKPIQSLELVSPIYASGNTGQGYNLTGDRWPGDFVPCFTPGTMIVTPKGEVPVETLIAGDSVFTRDNGPQTIRWVGSRTLSPYELAASPAFQPVLIRAGALGDNLPERDLLLSPNHRVLMTSQRATLYFEENEVLAAAKHLTALDGVDAVSSGSVCYVHLLFDRHEVILSNGAWSESFLPGDYSLQGIGDEQRAEILTLFPDLMTSNGVTDFAAARRLLRRHEASVLTS